MAKLRERERDQEREGKKEREGRLINGEKEKLEESCRAF